ncbi:MAG TPA: NADH-quinone oxidoreductase subunit E, partial [Bauldia sp.]|nr:NADH-quinone oxidoreductase subunit E [Bauldia sp.]
VNAPLVQVNADTYEDLTAASFNALLDEFAAGKKPKPGPRIERQLAAPVGRPTTLTGDIYRPGAEPWRAPQPALTDSEAKKPTEGASNRESPAPKPPVQANPEDKKPNPVSKV